MNNLFKSITFILISCVSLASYSMEPGKRGAEDGGEPAAKRSKRESNDAEIKDHEEKNAGEHTSIEQKITLLAPEPHF